MSKYRIVQTGPRQFTVHRKYLFWWVHIRKYVGGEEQWWNRVYFETVEGARCYIQNQVNPKEEAHPWVDVVIEEFSA